MKDESTRMADEKADEDGRDRNELWISHPGVHIAPLRNFLWRRAKAPIKGGKKKLYETSLKNSKILLMINRFASKGLHQYIGNQNNPKTSRPLKYTNGRD